MYDDRLTIDRLVAGIPRRSTGYNDGDADDYTAADGLYIVAIVGLAGLLTITLF